MISFHEEQFGEFFADGQELFPMHYEELALNKDEVKLELDVTRYEKAEKDGILHIATIRDEGQLVGYYVSVILTHLHYASLLCASTDMYWIVPEYRAQCGAAFIRFVEHCWRKRGVKKAYLSCKVHADKQKFFEALGYTFSDKFFVKLI